MSFLVVVLSSGEMISSVNKRRTTVSIHENMFFINNKPTYNNRYWNGNKIEGLLMNSRMVQGIFDDENPATVGLWKYPDTGVWSADRNTDEFIAAMPEWKRHGLLAFTLNLQGGSPLGYGNNGWINTAFNSVGDLKPTYMTRLEKILDAADKFGMVCILGYFYFGQDEFLNDEKAVIAATNNATDWILKKGYKNVIIEIANECDLKEYNHNILRCERIHELINLVKNKNHNGQRLLTGTSFSGKFIPTGNVVKISDFILIHGNGISNPKEITTMIEKTRKVEGYRNQPVLFNEDDHFEFKNADNNLVRAVQSYVSWGYFDFRFEGETDYHIGYQSVPIDWSINSDRKKDFFNLLKRITIKK